MSGAASVVAYVNYLSFRTALEAPEQN
jgi:hypothetical protein